MKKATPGISEAEWRVMQVLWDRAPRTANEVVEALQPTLWNERTIKTMLNRLVRKRALKYKKDGRMYLYSPAVDEASCVQAETQAFAKRVFGGAMKPLMAHFLESEPLNADEIEELRRILDQRRRGQCGDLRRVFGSGLRHRRAAGRDGPPIGATMPMSSLVAAPGAYPFPVDAGNDVKPSVPVGERDPGATEPTPRGLLGRNTAAVDRRWTCGRGDRFGGHDAVAIAVVELAAWFRRLGAGRGGRVAARLGSGPVASHASDPSLAARGTHGSVCCCARPACVPTFRARRWHA